MTSAPGSIHQRADTAQPRLPDAAGPVLLTGDRELAKRVKEQWLPEAHFTPSLTHEDGATVDAAVVVLCVYHFSDEYLVMLRCIRLLMPAIRVLVVAHLSPANANYLLAQTRGELACLVWLEEAATSLRSSVIDALTSHFLDRGAEVMLTALRPPLTVARFVQVVWTQPRPPTTVDRALVRGGLTRSRFYDDWQQLGIVATPKGLVDWALVGRSFSQRASGGSWDRAAAQIRTTSRRIERATRRHLSTSPAEALSRELAWLEARYWTWLQRSVLGLRRDPHDQALAESIVGQDITWPQTGISGTDRSQVP